MAVNAPFWLPVLLNETGLFYNALEPTRWPAQSHYDNATSSANNIQHHTDNCCSQM